MREFDKQPAEPKNETLLSNEQVKQEFAKTLEGLGLTAEDMLALIKVPSTLNTHVKLMRAAAIRSQSSHSKMLKESKERLNTITPAIIEDAVRALHANGITPSMRQVSLYVDNKMGGEGKINGGLWLRLKYFSKNPIIDAQRKAYINAIAATKPSPLQTDTLKSQVPEIRPSDVQHGTAVEPVVPDFIEAKVSTQNEPNLEPIQNITSSAHIANPEIDNQPKPALEPAVISTTWTITESSSENINRLAKNVEILLQRIATQKNQEWVRKFAPKALDDIESRITDIDNALLDLEESLKEKVWGDNSNTAYVQLRRRLMEIEKEIDSLDGSVI